MSRSARSTVVRLPIQALQKGAVSGRQRRHGRKPAVSAAAFFGTIPILPYKLVAEPRRDCVYTLGHYRPGSYAPYRRNRIPIRADATLVEMGLITGVVFMVP